MFPARHSLCAAVRDPAHLGLLQEFQSDILSTCFVYKKRAAQLVPSHPSWMSKLALRSRGPAVEPELLHFCAEHVVLFTVFQLLT